jgi:hypothetical protein
MAENITTNAAVLNRWLAPDPPADDESLTMTIGRAERAIRQEVPTLATRLAATDPEGNPLEPDLAERVGDVVYDLVLDAVSNPLGERTRSTNTGPFGESVTVGGDNPGRMVLTKAQKEFLGPPRTPRSRMGMIDSLAGSWAAQGRPVLPGEWPW